MGKDSAARIELGRSFDKMGTLLLFLYIQRFHNTCIKSLRNYFPNEPFSLISKLLDKNN